MAGRAPRLYVPLDVAFFDDDKVIEAGEPAAWLFLAALTRAKHLDSDGVLSRAQMSRLGVPGWQKRVERCVKAGLFIEHEPGVYLIPAWRKWNELAADREARLAVERKRKAEARARVTAGGQQGAGDAKS